MALSQNTQAGLPYGLQGKGAQGFYNYQSMAGVDIKITLGGYTFGNVQAISYSISREVAPAYTMGSPSPRSFSRGKRAIAGSMVTIMFDAHALIAAFRREDPSISDQAFVVSKDEPRPGLVTEGKGQKLVTKGSLDNREKPLVGGRWSPSFKLSDGWEGARPWYVDQIPPFNVTMTAVNELGGASQMAIFGVQLINEGHGMSIDDIQAEHQFTFVAREVSAWSPIFGDTIPSGNLSRQYTSR